ncbi:NUDIX domain-containing protein [Streptomyces sp. NPDC059534]|uniref:NUDIX domain-containing protein n=1 Tax=Streptomyces sp. NPDC059534 TaxID=3346859 RepID=UPI0036795EA3
MNAHAPDPHAPDPHTSDPHAFGAPAPGTPAPDPRPFGTPAPGTSGSGAHRPERPDRVERVDYVDPGDRVVAQGRRAAVAPDGLLRRYAATVCTDRAGRVLLYRRTASARAYPGHYDVLVGGAVRTGEEYRAAALRELREELGWATAPGLAEVYRVRVDDPHGACFLTVHRWAADRAPRPDPREIAWCGFVSPLVVVTGGYTPLVPAGAEAVRRLFLL